MAPHERRGEIERLVAAGHGNREIAERLALPLHAVKREVADLRAALGDAPREAIGQAVVLEAGETRRRETAAVAAALLLVLGPLWLLLATLTGSPFSTSPGTDETRPVARRAVAGAAWAAQALDGRSLTARPSGSEASRAPLDPMDPLSVPDTISVTTRLPEGFTYAVRPGDTAESVAARFHVDVQTVAALSPGVLDPAGLPAGSIVPVPPGADALQFLRFGWSTPLDLADAEPPELWWPLLGEVERAVQSDETTGIDIRTPTGTPVRAAADGVVAAVGMDGCCSYGRAVIVDHGDGYATVYAHLGWVRAARGQPVRRGEVLGGSGPADGSAGPRLHFGLLRGDAVHTNVRSLAE